MSKNQNNIKEDSDFSINSEFIDSEIDNSEVNPMKYTEEINREEKNNYNSNNNSNQNNESNYDNPIMNLSTKIDTLNNNIVNLTSMINFSLII